MTLKQYQTWRSKKLKLSKPKKRNKYGATKTEYNGRKFDSWIEAEYARELDLLIKAGEVSSWEPQHVIKIYGRNGSYVCRYVIDFKVILRDGSIELVEIKGKATATWRIKLKLAIDELIDEPLTLVVIYGRKQYGQFVRSKVERYRNGKKL